MRRRTAQADLVERTLDRIPSLLGKITFLSELKRGGEYSHWGMERLHGRADTASAISAAHTRCVLDFLSKRFLEQSSDCNREAQRLNVPVRDLLSRLRAVQENLAPIDWSGGSPEHFAWALFVLANWQVDSLIDDVNA